MPEQTLDNETRYTLLRRLEDNPGASQRELASELGISLGKTNYCLKALLDKGYIKASNFRNSHNKRAYLYQLTPKGIAAKSRATARFLARKQADYERLAEEIEVLRREAAVTEVATKPNMRLTSRQAAIIKRHAQAIFGEQAIVRLFGSRTDIARKGGDIDLYIEPEEKTNLLSRRNQLIGSLQLELGDQKIDVVLARNPNRPIEQRAKATGIRL